MAKQQGIAYTFDFTELPESSHPNAMKFELTGQAGRTVSLVGDSTGGGMVETQQVNGYPLRVKGDTYVLLIFDPEQAVTPAQVEGLKRELPALVGASHSRAAAGGMLHYFKTAEPPELEAIRAGFPDREVALLRPVLPVITTPNRQPQLFNTMTGWRELVEAEGAPLWEIAVRYQMAASGWSRREKIDYMGRVERRMHRQTHASYEAETTFPVGPFKPDMAGEWESHRQSNRRLTDELTANTLKWAYGAGAGIPGVEVVAGPMGGGGGYVHAALWAVKEAKGFSQDDLLRGLFIAAGVGAIAFSRTEPTGECIGCTGECGICGAMAAAGIAEMAGGEPEQVEHAGSMLLQALIGMPCDPIPGGLGQPCRSRIITATCMAHIFADLALAGRDAVLPLHEAIDVTDAVGRQLPPQLRCTSLGGACIAPAARRRMTRFADWFEQIGQNEVAGPPLNLI